ncbi:hypothetical protein [Nocardia carnea]|uniref:Uncharacterized protein n=1 Tax=Nocardia carnea TaxID=37328 RepID=A0ABW7TKD4_9NOCA|nr:hypothetical protein [Nocardia carnea]
MVNTWGRAHMLHPDTAAALESGRAFVHAAHDMFEAIDKIRARRPSPSSRVIPEVDGMGRLTDLYIAPGTIAAFDRAELVADIMAGIHDSTVDALRQHRSTVEDAHWPMPRRHE